MSSSTFQASTRLHVAIIMDGNGRWAQQRGQARSAGHLAGARAVRRTVEEARRLKLGTLTLHAFSSDNWKRPREETGRLMELFESYLERETARCIESGIRLTVVGRRNRLPWSLVRAIRSAEKDTSAGKALHLRLAVDYSARYSLWQAAQRCGPSTDQQAFPQLLANAAGEDSPAPDVDLLIRCGGEQRLSDLFGWECAYAELLFLPTLWPDFDTADLRRAIEEFRRRERRYGALPVVASASNNSAAGDVPPSGTSFQRKSGQPSPPEVRLAATGMQANLRESRNL